MNKPKIYIMNGDEVTQLTLVDFTVLMKIYQWLHDSEEIMFGECRIIKENKYIQIQPSLIYRVSKDN